MLASFTNAKKSVFSLFSNITAMILPFPENLECAFEIQGEFDGAGCKRSLLLDSVRNKIAFESQISCEADIRVKFFGATEKRVDAGIERIARHSFDVDHLQKIMPELNEQDVFDIFRIFQMFQRDPKEMLTSRAEIIVSTGLLGHVGPIEEFIDAFRPDQDSYFLDTSYEGIDFEEFLHSFYALVVLPKPDQPPSPLAQTFGDLFHEMKIRRNMTPIQRIMARMH